VTWAGEVWGKGRSIRREPDGREPRLSNTGAYGYMEGDLLES